MPIYSIEGPKGQIYEIEGPEGASRDQVISAITEQLQAQQNVIEPWSTSIPEPEVESSFLRESADIPLKAGEGVVAGVRMIADAFGADNPISQNLKAVEGYIADLYSAQSKADSKEVSRLMQEAEDQGVLANVQAGLKAFTVAPVDMLVNALGTSAPTIIGGLGAGVLKAGTAGVRAVQAGLGATTGAGVTKGGIYQAVTEELQGSGLTPEQIEQKAQLAQAYGGENLDQILMGTGIGAVAGSVGIESAVAGVATKNILQKSALKQAGLGAAKEGGTEAIQGGQEQLSQNIALQREGFDVPTMRGVVGAGTLEGLAGAGLGAPISGLGQRRDNIEVEKQAFDADVARDNKLAVINKERSRQANNVAAAQQAVEDVKPKLALPNYAQETLLSFADGSVGTQADADAFIAALPEEQQAPARAKLLGLGSVTAQPEPEPPAIAPPLTTQDEMEYTIPEVAPEFTAVEDIPARRDYLSAQSDLFVDRAQPQTILATPTLLTSLLPKVAKGSKLYKKFVNADLSDPVTYESFTAEVDKYGSRNPVNEVALKELDDAVSNRGVAAGPSGVSPEISDAGGPIEPASTPPEFDTVPVDTVGDTTGLPVGRAVDEYTALEPQSAEVLPTQPEPEVAAEAPSVTPEERQQRIIARRAEEEAARSEERAVNQSSAIAEQRGRSPTTELLPAEQEGLEAAREFEADESEFEIAKGTAGAFIRQTFSGSQNITPEERVTLPQFLAALADIMYHIVRKGITSRAQANKEARSSLGDSAKDVTDFQLNKAFTEASERVEAERTAQPEQRELREPSTPAAQPAQSEALSDPAYVESSEDLIESLYTRRVADARVDLGGFVERITPKLLSLYQLVDQFGKDITGLSEHRDLKDSMTVMQRNIKVSADAELLKWNNFNSESSNKEASKQLNELMSDATMARIHPNLEFDAALNSHLTSDLKGYHTLLKARFNALPAAAQDIYTNVLAMNNTIFNLRSSEYKKMVDAAYETELLNASPERKAQIEARIVNQLAAHDNLINSIRGPYFTLWREGNYLTIAESPELTEVRRTLKEDELTAVERKRISGRLTMMEASDDHYQVFANEKKSGAVNEGERLKKLGLTVRQSLAEEAMGSSGGMSMDMVNNLERLLDKELDRSLAPEERSRLRQAMIDDMLSRLPENSALQRQIKRRNVAGASTEMLKAFANSVERDSHYISRLAYMKPLAKSMIDMRDSTKGDPKLRGVYNTVRKMMNLDMKQEKHPILSKITQLSSIYHLGIAPSYILTNMTQPFMITIPQLAGTYGAAKTSKAVSKAWGQASKAIKGGKDGTFFSLANVDLSKVFTGGTLRMVQEMQDLGKLDIQNNMDTEVYTKGMNPKHAKFWQVFNWTSHNVELVNRLTTALAAYELELGKSNSEVAATKAARDAVELTQLDYSDTNAALFMKQGQLGGFNRIPMQFRKYQQGMIYLLARNFKNGWGANNDPEAKAAFLYLMGTQLLMAGVKGVPFVAPLLFLMDAFGDDDDPEGDIATQLRNSLADSFGADTARVFWNGLPAMLGVDASSLSMENLLSPFPFLRTEAITDARSGRDAASELMINVGGAPISLATRLMDAFILMNEGSMQKGLEKAIPKFLAAPLKAQRLGDEGLTTRSGNVVLEGEEFTMWDQVIKGAGFSPLKESEYYKAMYQKESVSAAIDKRRNRIIKDLATTRMEGGNTADLLKDLRAFNKDHPQRNITGESISSSITMRRRQQRERSGSGVRFAKRDGQLRGIDRFAE